MGRLNDLSGQQFHYWTVLDRAGSTLAKKATWNCICQCGTTRIVVGSDLKKGASKSCGCHQKEVASSICVHGMADTQEYSIWCAMKARCQNSKVSNYHNYGGRGISVCERWETFENFYADMGDCGGLTIERIDTNGDYEPSNCRWATRKEQGNNKRNNRLLSFDGLTLTVQQWADRIGIGEATIRKRLRLGWSTAKALTTEAVIGRNQHGVA